MWFAGLAVAALVAGLAGQAVAMRATQGGLIDDPEWYPVWVAPVRLLVVPAAVGAAALGAIAARLLLGRAVSLGPAVVTAATGLYLAVSTVDGVVPWLAVAAVGIGWSLAGPRPGQRTLAGRRGRRGGPGTTTAAFQRTAAAAI
ncbi:hypothetical protein Val02_37420 [Virgisporangium aliadipatigenens]|uniref:Uncharacterized protein n=1 Tax=Virgisporangium aliadipatigenens TaxID=741659 RepID=A0A8J4DRA2_9ACTN|nr:hypothetical protein [Virgisporangium aliadipatigenens]GIJ46856.1 hypothetical protein Val02_37420 [Virgisporangium aliadipatigenens]